MKNYQKARKNIQFALTEPLEKAINDTSASMNLRRTDFIRVVLGMATSGKINLELVEREANQNGNAD